MRTGTDVLDSKENEKGGFNLETIMDYGPPGSNPGHDPISPPPPQARM